MMAPFARSAADDRRVLGRGVHRVVASAPPVERMSVVSKTSLNDNADAVHRQLLEIGIAAVLRVELGRALERVGLLAGSLAAGGAPAGSGPVDGRRRIALARHRSLAAQIERAERVHLSGIRDADTMPYC